MFFTTQGYLKSTSIDNFITGEPIILDKSEIKFFFWYFWEKSFFEIFKFEIFLKGGDGYKSLRVANFHKNGKGGAYYYGRESRFESMLSMNLKDILCLHTCSREVHLVNRGAII